MWAYWTGFVVTFALALLGAIVTIWPIRDDDAKPVILFAFAVLALFSGALDLLNRQKEGREQAELRGQLTQMSSQLAALRDLPAQIDKIGQIRAAPTGLKHEARELSQSVLRFLLERGSPRAPRSESWSADVQAMLAHFDETMRLYSLSLAPSVIAMRQRLAERGLIDGELDKFYEHPTNAIGIRIVGERLGALAERLPN